MLFRFIIFHLITSPAPGKRLKGPFWLHIFLKHSLILKGLSVGWCRSLNTRSESWFILLSCWPQPTLLYWQNHPWIWQRVASCHSLTVILRKPFMSDQRTLNWEEKKRLELPVPMCWRKKFSWFGSQTGRTTLWHYVFIVSCVSVKRFLCTSCFTACSSQLSSWDNLVIVST